MKKLSMQASRLHQKGDGWDYLIPAGAYEKATKKGTGRQAGRV